MPTNMPEELQQMNERVERLEGVIQQLVKSDRYTVEKSLLQFLDGRNVQCGTSVGTKIGTATNQLIGFYNATPVNQPDTISDPSGQANDLDSESRTAINALIDRLQELGLIA